MVLRISAERMGDVADRIGGAGCGTLSGASVTSDSRVRSSRF